MQTIYTNQKPSLAGCKVSRLIDVLLYYQCTICYTPSASTDCRIFLQSAIMLQEEDKTAFSFNKDRWLIKPIRIFHTGNVCLFCQTDSIITCTCLRNSNEQQSAGMFKLEFPGPTSVMILFPHSSFMFWVIIWFWLYD